MKNFNPKNISEVRAFFDYLVNVEKCEIKPDMDFGDFIDYKTETPAFSTDEEITYNRVMDQCKVVCGKYGVDIYELADECMGITPKEKDNFGINKLMDQAKEIQRKIAEKIKSLPQNDKINPLSSGAYTMNSKHLSGDKNLSPTHYDFKKQYSLITMVLSRTGPENIYKKLKEIVQTGKLRVTATNTIILHKEVIAYLREIL